MGESWYVVEAHVGRELTADYNLKRQGFHTFLPLCVRRIRHAGRTHRERRAYLPGYLFIQKGSALEWRSVNGTIGAKRLMCDGYGNPRAVRPGEVERLIDLSARGHGLISVEPDELPPFKAGETIRIIEGMFAFNVPTAKVLSCTVESVAVELPIMGRVVPAIIPCTQVVPINV